MFGKRKERGWAILDEKPSIDLVQKSREENKKKTYEYFEHLAKQKEAQVLSEADDLRKSFSDDHRKDMDAFEFECKRFHDYLNVRVARASGETVQAINIGQSVKIVPNEGCDPADSGIVNYFVDIKYKPRN